MKRPTAQKTIYTEKQNLVTLNIPFKAWGTGQQSIRHLQHVGPVIFIRVECHICITGKTIDHHEIRILQIHTRKDKPKSTSNYEKI